MTELMRNTILKNIFIRVLFDSKKRSSFCWKYFGDLVIVTAGKKKIIKADKVYCAVCFSRVKEENEFKKFGTTKIKGYSKNVSTGNMIRHLKDIHDIMIHTNNYDSDNAQVDEVFTASSKTLDQAQDNSLVARDLALWFCQSLMPFDSINDEGMNTFFKKYNMFLTDDELPSPNVVSGGALDDIYESMTRIIQQRILNDTAPHLAVSFDSWTDRYHSLNHVTLTVHYLSAEFKPEYFTVSTQILEDEPPEKKIMEFLKETQQKFGFVEKKIYVVTGAAGYIHRAISQAKFDHHMCLGHGLHNLVTIDGINQVEEVETIVKKCKNIIKTLYYRLPKLEIHTKRIQTQFLSSLEDVAKSLLGDENDPVPDIVLTQLLVKAEESPLSAINNASSEYIPPMKPDTPTRWHCVLEILECIMRLGIPDPINDLLGKIKFSNLKITETEWNTIKDLVNFLRKIRQVVEVISSQKKCTINVALIFRSEIIDILNSNPEDQSFIITNLKQNMLSNLSKRFPLTKTIVAAALLDCRFTGLKDIDVYLESVNMVRASFLASYVRELVCPSVVHEINNVNVATTSTMPISTDGSSTSTVSLLHKLSQKHNANSYQAISDDPIDQECWRYLASVDPKEPKDGNLLNFWNEKRHSFPLLSTLARALLCVPATRTPSERVFTSSGLVFTAKTLRLCLTKVNKMIFVHENLKYCKNNAVCM